MHWITTLGIILIAVGTILTCFGQNIMNRFDNKKLLRSVSEKTFRIDELTTGNNKLLARIDEYQKSLLEKDKIIQQLEVRNDGLDVLSSGQDFNEVIAKASRLCDEGKYDEAHKIADDLRQKDPEFGLAYLVLGAIEVRKKNYDKGEELLNRAAQLVLTDKDKAWVSHNLGISSIQKKDYEKAKMHLEKAIKLNPGMKNSKKAIEALNEHLRLKQATVQVKSYFNEGKYDKAYKIADDLRQKNPELGLAYFILGTIELSREHYDRGEGLLKKSVNLGLPDEDMAWAFHNLGISSLRKKDFKKARDFLEKAILMNPDMEESRKTLNELDNLRKNEKHEES